MKPPLFHQYEIYLFQAENTGLFATISVVNRFAARYRLAKSFQGLILNDYSENTVAGYNSLTKISLCWSAFEQFKKALHIADTRPLLKKYNFENLSNEIIETDPDFIFLNFIKRNLKAKNKQDELDSFIINKKVTNPLLLSESIRHIYFHGALTPHADKVDVNKTIDICNSLSNCILEIIDFEFKSRVEKLNELMSAARWN